MNGRYSRVKTVLFFRYTEWIVNKPTFEPFVGSNAIILLPIYYLCNQFPARSVTCDSPMV